jgi:predicted PurR-regulated permease PerM
MSSYQKISISTGTMFRFVCIILGLVALFYLKNLVLVLLTAIVIASFVESAVARFRRFHFPRTLTVVLVYILGLMAIVALFYVFVPIFFSELSSLVDSFAIYIPQTSALHNLSLASPTVGNTQALVSDIAGGTSSVSQLVHDARSLVSGVTGGFIQTASFLFGGLVNLALIVIISFYLSLQERGIENFLRIVTPQKKESYVIGLWQRTERKIGLWMQGQMLLGVIIGILTYLGLTLLGVKYALVIALTAALFELIPFGLIIAVIPAIAFAYVGGGIALVIRVAGWFLVIQQFENYLLQPLIVKKVVGISPLVVILSVLVGAELAGFWGVILAIPVAVFLLEYLSDVEKRKEEQTV